MKCFRGWLWAGLTGHRPLGEGGDGKGVVVKTVNMKWSHINTWTDDLVWEFVVSGRGDSGTKVN